MTTVEDQLKSVIEQVRHTGGTSEDLLVVSHDAMQAAWATWKALSAIRTAAVVALRYETGMAHEDIAGVIGVSRQRINQILDKYTDQEA